jgi:ABC transporter substrate binding protein
MRRRNFIAGLASTTATWPVAGRAQQPERVRRIGVLLNLSENDVEAQRLVEVFRERLAQLGWADGRNLLINYRWAGGDVGQIRTFAKELVELSPDIMVGYATPSVAALQQETRSIPIVFLSVTDPVGQGLVASLATSGRQYNGLRRIRALVGHQVDGRSQTDSARSQEGHHNLQSKDGAVLRAVLGRYWESRFHLVSPLGFFSVLQVSCMLIRLLSIDTTY